MSVKILLTCLLDQIAGSRNYPHYLYNLADLFAKNDVTFNNELTAWSSNHSTETFPKNFEIFYKFFTAECDIYEFGRILPKLNILQANLLNPEMANRLIYSAGEIYLKSNSYLKSYYKYI